MAKHLFRICITFLFPFSIYSQANYPQNYFDSPIKNNLSLVGNFGEIRPNHFHSGFDIRTNNKEGIPVYSVADGYVSRIKISATGYGKAIYITHPNGYTSVYGHLQSFNTAIGDYTKQIQYAKQSFEIDTIIAPSLLLVKKGDLIALSGNTGSSSGPHLHFEIRETSTEFPVNPYEFGYKIPDQAKPVITLLAIYPVGKTATVNGLKNIKKIKPAFENNKYTTSPTDTIIVNGEIGFGIGCYDTESNSTNKNGVFSVELQSGGKRIYFSELEKFNFDNSRYVNAHIDYAANQEKKEVIQKCFLSKNNRLEIYKGIINNGIINFKDDSVHWIKYIVKDFAGNASEIMLKVKSSSKVKNTAATNDSCKTFDCFKENKITEDDIQLTIPALALYDDVCFNYSKTKNAKAAYAPLYHIQDDKTALQKAYTLRIKAQPIMDSLLSKMCIVSFEDNGKVNYEGGSYKDGWVSADLKSLGNFTIYIDKLRPLVKPNFIIKDNMVDLSAAKAIEFRAMDNLSGIKKYRIMIDGKWVLCEYEPKKSLLFYTFDDHVPSGKHSCELEVRDDKNNISVVKFSFTK